MSALLKLENICYSYDTKKNVLKDISYEFDPGHIYSIVGKSGAGETTLLSILSGLASPTDGTIYYNGSDIKKINKYGYRSKYVYLRYFITILHHMTPAVFLHIIKRSICMFLHF